MVAGSSRFLFRTPGEDEQRLQLLQLGCLRTKPTSFLARGLQMPARAWAGAHE